MGALRCSVMYGGTNRTDKESRPGGFDASILYWEMGFRRAVVEERPQPGFAYLSSLLAPELNESSANSNCNGFGAIIGA